MSAPDPIELPRDGDVDEEPIEPQPSADAVDEAYAETERAIKEEEPE